MPALPPVAGVARLDMHFALPGDPNAMFRKFFGFTGALSQTAAQTWVTSMSATWNTRLASLIANTTTLYLAVLTDLTSATGAQAQEGTSHAGTNVNPSEPNALALIVKDKVARRYRGGHPKTYVPGYPTANLATSNAWGAAALALFLTAWNNWISDILTNVPVANAPATEVNVSYFSGFHNVTYPSGRVRSVPSPRAVPVVDLILSHSMNPTPASQRRRNENP